jgi:hypothetical protein
MASRVRSRAGSRGARCATRRIATVAIRAFRCMKQSGSVRTVMDEDRFWNLVSQARQAAGSGDPETTVQHVEQLLAELDPREICSFDDRLHDVVSRAYTCKMSGAETIISGFSSDDGFLYFVHWLVLQGRASFDRALADPDSIADIDRPGAENGAESFMYAASNAYEEATGNEMPLSGVKVDMTFRGDKPRGEAAELYPRLWRRYRDSNGRPSWWPPQRR